MCSNDPPSVFTRRCVSKRRACRTLGQHRPTQRNGPQGRADEDRLTEDIVELLNGELFYSLKEAQILIEQWRA